MSKKDYSSEKKGLDLMSMLLSPVVIASLNLKNRVVMSPMRTYSVQTGDGKLNPLHFAHYGARAVEQVGLVVIEVTAVEPNGRTTARDLGLWNDEQQKELKKLVDFLHDLGTKVGIQLGHAGRKAQDSVNIVAPSETAYNETTACPTKATEEKIQEIEAAFVKAAKRANAAGVDMIEIQGANGFLIDEFLSPLVNQRTDAYGGDLRKRYRFLHEIVTAIRHEYDGSLWVRLSLDDYVEEEEQNKLSDWQQVGQWLKEDGASCISVTTGGLLDKKPDYIYTGWQVPYARAMKEKVALPIAASGMLLDPKLCEYILETRQADLILEAHVFEQNASWIADATEEFHEGTGSYADFERHLDEI